MILEKKIFIKKKRSIDWVLTKFIREFSPDFKNELRNIAKIFVERLHNDQDANRKIVQLV